MAAETGPILVNEPAPGFPYFTPLQSPPAGTALLDEGKRDVPKLFRPLKIRGVLLQNRIMLSPLCQYSADDGHYTPWHTTHIGGIVQRGPGLTCIEATAVTPNGRITPQCVGLWKDSQIENIQRVVEFSHSQNQKIMIQLAHAGRKASTVAPWLSAKTVATEEFGGWPKDCWAPSAIAYSEDLVTPKEMTLQDIEEFKACWLSAVRRALACGFDAIEIHNAHGYLLHEFLSPVSNKRTDKYGGSWENRVRLTLEVVEETRKIIPESMPLFLRISATDFLEGQDEFPESWTGEDTVKLAPLLAERGLDALDVSGGGNHPKQAAETKPGYQSSYAVKVKNAVGDKLIVGAVGMIENATLANKLLTSDGLDFVAVGRAFQKNPGLVFTWGDELSLRVNMPNQIRWGFAGRGLHNTVPATSIPELIEGKA